MKTRKLGLWSLLIVAALSGAVRAQAQRTFVAFGGSDGNPCSRTAPCRNFRQAVSHTNPGGEVIALDSAGYGAFVIDRAISIIAPPGVYAGVSVFSGHGIDVNASQGDVVTLRGLTINSQGQNNEGISFNSGTRLHVETCIANGFDGAGIDSSGSGHLFVRDTICRNNRTGIIVHPPLGIGVVASLDNVRLDGNGTGLAVQDGVEAAIRDSVITSFGGGTGCLVTGTQRASLDIERCLIAELGVGIDAENTGPTLITLSNTTLTHNTRGYQIAAGASISSRGNNTIAANGFNAGALTPLAGQ